MVFIDEDKFKDDFGIYKITNIVNGKAYIGQTGQTFDRRFWHHQWKLNDGSHDNYHLQQAWNKYGSDAFLFSVVQVCTDRDVLDKKQVEYIDKYDTYNRGYNMTVGGEGKRGCPMSEHAKKIVGEKNRAHMKGRKASEQTKRKMSESSPHTPCSVEHKKKLSEYMSNRVVSQETKDKISEMTRGSKSNFAKIDQDMAARIKILCMQGLTPTEIAEKVGVTYQIASSIRLGDTWRHVKVPGWDEWCTEYCSANCKK